MAEDEERQPGGINIVMPLTLKAGVWANSVRTSVSPYEFTLDFIRIDYDRSPPDGILVARVSMAPTLVVLLMNSLQRTWEGYAEATLPKEVGRGIQDDRPDE